MRFYSILMPMTWITFGILTGITIYLLYPSRKRGGLWVAFLLALIGAIIGRFIEH